MRRIVVIAICLAFVLSLAGCAKGGSGMGLFNGEKTVGKQIKQGDITEFYYTYSNINYDAFYQRYRFYVEDGKHMFFHETRERKDEYGPTTEKDITKTGTIELTDEQWTAFYELLEGGTAVKRSESASTGDSGPWLYLYWKNDKGKIQEFSFASYDRRKAFEEFCGSLVE